MVSPPALPSKIVDHKGNRAIIGQSQIAEPSSIDPDSSFLMFLKCSRGFFYSCSRKTLMNGGTGFMPRKALMNGLSPCHTGQPCCQRALIFPITALLGGAGGWVLFVNAPWNKSGPQCALCKRCVNISCHHSPYKTRKLSCDSSHCLVVRLFISQHQS